MPNASHRGKQNEAPAAASTKRKRTVYKADEIPHRWAYAMDDFPVRGGNLSTVSGVKGHTWGLSYRTPIVLRVETSVGVVYLSSHETYSKTSSAHLTDYSRAIPDDARQTGRVFCVPCLSGKMGGSPFHRFGSASVAALDADAHTANLSALISDAEKVRAIICNPRMDRRHWITGKTWQDAIRKAEFYRQIFAPRRKPITVPTDEQAAALDAERDAIDAKKAERDRERRERHGNAISEWTAKGLAAIAPGTVEALNADFRARALTLGEEMEAARQEWKTNGSPQAAHAFSKWGIAGRISEPFGERISAIRDAFRAAAGECPRGPLRVNLHGILGILSTDDLAQTVPTLGTALRLSSDGEQVETSDGATLPVSHARVAWALLRPYVIKALAGLDPEFPAELQGRHIGPFRLNTVDRDAVRIGCHILPNREVAEMARTLGLEGAPAA